MTIDEAVKVLREFADLSCAPDAPEVKAVNVLTHLAEDYLKNRMSVEDIADIIFRDNTVIDNPEYNIPRRTIESCEKLAEVIHKEMSRRLGI